MRAKKRHHRGRLLAGVGIVAAAVAVGGKLLYGKGGAKNRKKLEGWAGDLKEDAVAVFADAKVVSRKAYHDAVEVAAKKYKKLQSIDARDVEKAVRDVKGHWRDVEKKLAKTTKIVKKATKKTVRKAAR